MTMTEIKSASDEEMAYSAKGNSDGNNGGLPQQGQAPQAAPKPYMTFGRRPGAAAKRYCRYQLRL